jgi:RNA polymerase sigma-70 factor (ECF subfamily)
MIHAATGPTGPTQTAPASLPLADPAVFADLVERHGGVAFSLAMRICQNRSLAEDVVQDAFLSIWRGPASYDATRGSLRNWLLSVVHNRAIDALRRERRHSSREVGDVDPAIAVADPVCLATAVELRDLVDRVRRALTYLPAEQRQVIELAYLRDWTQLEIATATGLAPGTVKSRIRLAKVRLRAMSTESLSA